MNKDRAHTIAEVLEPQLEPGDVALIIGRDDSRMTLYGANFRQAYAEGQWSPAHTVWGVVLGFKVLGEILGHHMKTCLPNEKGDIMQVPLTKMEIEQFQRAMQAGSLMPADTFPLVANAYKEMAQVLEGHLASCAPNEYRRLAEAHRSDPDRFGGGGGGSGILT